MSKNTTRRETLGILGAAGLTALVGCSDEPGDGTAGAGASGTGGSSGSGTGTGGTGTGGLGGGGAGGGGAGGSGGSGTGGAGGAGGSSGAGGSAGAGGSGGASGSGGTGGAGSGGEGGGAGTAGGGAGGNGGAGGAGAGGGGAGGNGGSGGSDPVDCEGKEETTVGPFPNIDPLDRRDVRGNTTGTTTPKEGAEFVLRLGVYDLDQDCAPIPGAVVDIWACDAVGDYAGYADFGTTGQDFCRGYQKTDASGVAEFLTIFPGSYTGRAIHIHFSLQGSPNDLSPNADGAGMSDVFVAQLYFEADVANEIFDAFPIYQQGAAITRNESDSIFTGNGGRDLMVKVTKTGTGYAGDCAIGVRRSEIGM